MSAMGNIMFIVDEIINDAIDNRGYAYGSIMDEVDLRTDLDEDQRAYIVDYFKELFSHDSH